MVTVSHLVKKAVEENPFLLEAMSRGLVSYGSLAEELKPDVEKELGKKVKESAVVMALRRYADELERYTAKIGKFAFRGEMILKTNIADFNVVKSQQLLSKIKNLYSMISFEKGDTLNIIVGNNEISIITNEKYREKLASFLEGEKVLHTEKNLVALTISFDTKDFLSTPGVIFTAVRKLAWENINVYEIVSTTTELTFILSKKDSIKAYNLLHKLFSK